MSILSETVPSDFKNAKVIPLFKKGSKLEPGNYRPVSILPVLSKVLERAVNSQLTTFLEQNGILFENQSGFRGKYATDTCTIELTDYVKGEMSKGNLVGMVLIDLQKAFDTVDHSILISKLEAIGVSSVEWFRSYLSDRKQCVAVDGEQSDFLPITCGVPQGSILGPQLFLLYINDMHVSLSGCKLALYADDSALIFSHSDPSFIASVLSRNLTECKQWLVDNRLSLHVGKTECIVFGSPRRLRTLTNFQVACDGQPVKRVTAVKYLGVILDENMKGSQHVSDVFKKCAGRISFLFRNASLLNFHCRKLLCSAFITRYLDYWCTSWYAGLSKVLQGRLDVVQRRMVRFIFSLDARAHVGTEKLRELSWLSIRDRVTYFRLVHVFKIRAGLAPSYLSRILIPVSHSHNTRGSRCNFQVSKELAKNSASFCLNAVKQWNSLPMFLKEIRSLPSFRNQLRQHLASSY